MALLYGAKVRRKIFLSYHHKHDQAYYNAFSNAFHDTYEAVTDKSLEREVDSDDVDYVMRRIRENHISGTSCTILLVGTETYARKYVDWEIKATLDKEHGLIGVYLPNAAKNSEGKIIVPGRFFDNYKSGYAVWTSWANITRNVAICTGLIERANARSRKLIDNSRARRVRNG